MSRILPSQNVIMSPVLDLSETISVDPIREAGSNHTDVGIVARKKRKRSKKKKPPVDSTKVCKSIISVPDSHINAKQTMGNRSLSGVEDVIQRQNKANE